jgi:DNA-directed RNA polymerase specialized sigma24 family protein
VHARLSSDVRARESSMDALASLSEDHREVLTLARIVGLPTRLSPRSWNAPRKRRDHC